jgi:fatty acid desaturase
MEQEVIKPDRSPKGGEQAFGTTGIVIAALGAALLTLCLVGAAGVASVWAFSKMLGLPDIVIIVLLVAIIVPILMATIWTGSRAWHVEQRLARGQDVDTPVFKTLHYLRPKS